MLRTIRRGALRLLKSSGIFELTKNSGWRDQRLDALSAGNYTVLPLGDAIARLYRNDLPPKSVAITFDDGTYDFYALAYPLLKARGFPTTVYQTTYYCDYREPVFHLICSYMLWKRRGLVIKGMQNPEISKTLDLR